MVPGQKRATVPLELELQMVVTHHVGAGSFARAASAYNHWAISPAHQQLVFDALYIIA